MADDGNNKTGNAAAHRSVLAAVYYVRCEFDNHARVAHHLTTLGIISP